MEEENKNIKFYQKGWFIVLMLIFFFPLGLYLMWAYAKWSKTTKYIVTGILIVFFIIGLFTEEETAEVPNVTDMSFTEAKKTLNDKEFTNITLRNEKGDYIFKSSLSNKAIVVDQNPKAGEKISISTQIKLTIKDTKKSKKKSKKIKKQETKQEEKSVNTKNNKESKSKPSINEKQVLKSTVNNNLKDAFAKTSQLNYKVSLYNSRDVAMNGMISKNDYSNWFVTKVKNIDTHNKKVTFIIKSKEEINAEKIRKELESKVDETSAYMYVEQYGQRAYVYGFKLHYLVGNHYAYPLDASTWQVKSDCSITNGFGATRRVTCEAKVKVLEKENKVRVYDFKEY